MRSTILYLWCATVVPMGYLGQRADAACNPDTQAPTLTCPAKTYLFGSIPATLPQAKPLSLTDNCDGSPSVSQSPVSGTSLGRGTRIVTVKAVDNANNEATCEWQVVVPPFVQLIRYGSIPISRGDSTRNPGPTRVSGEGVVTSFAIQLQKNFNLGRITVSLFKGNNLLDSFTIENGRASEYVFNTPVKFRNNNFRVRVVSDDIGAVNTATVTIFGQRK